jgi:hypothetical protein
MHKHMLATLLAALACGGAPEAPPRTPLQQEFLALPTDVAPLFVLGDVNEDGRVDTLDQAVLSRVAERGRQDTSGVSCLAAADLTLDGEVDEADVPALSALLAAIGDTVALPLYGQPYLACSHKNRFVAAPMEWLGDGPVQVRLLKGRTSDQVELSLMGGPGEVQPLRDRTGWDIRLPVGLDTAALVTFRVSRGDTALSYTLANFSRTWQQAGDTAVVTAAAAATETWVEAGRTDLNGDGNVDDPRDMPPPTAFGEAIAAMTTCPQRGNGCEALLIDFMKNLSAFTDADQTKGALEAVGCNLVYVAPSFVTIPKPYLVVHRRLHTVTTFTVHPTQASIDAATASNKAAWLTVRDAIARHRTNVAAGKEMVLQLVAAHGSNSASYGVWGPGFSTGAGTLSRRDFHHGNYLVTRGKACNAIAMDRSCYSGNTPKVVDRLNNTGLADYLAPDPGINHGFHAAFWADMAASASSSTDACRNGSVFLLDISMGMMIRREGRNSDYERLAGQGFRVYVLDESPGKYNDRGYNHVIVTQCETASHVSTY